MKKPMVTREGNREHEDRYLGYFSQHSSKLSLIFRILAYGLLALEAVHFGFLNRILVYAVIADLCQYLFASITWGYACFRINNAPKYRAPWWTNFPTNTFFYLKVFLLVIYMLGRV